MKTLLAVLLAVPALAQIAEIATDGTGQTLLFNTRFRMQTESDATTEQKIYRWQNGVWTRLLVHTPSPARIPGSVHFPFAADNVYGWFITPGQGLFSPVRIHQDAEVFGITLSSDFPREYFRVSANGAFAAGGGGVPGELVVPQILNTRTGQRGRLPLNSTWLQVGSDGSFAYFAPGQGQIGFRRPGWLDEQRFSVVGELRSMAMTDDARWIAADVDRTLRLLDTSSGEWSTVGNAPTRWSIGNARAVFLADAGRQLMSWDFVAQRSAVVAESAEPFVELTLSADGNVAWAVTDTNRLLRFDLRAGLRDEILPPLGHATNGQPRGTVVPGSAALLPGQFTKGQEVFTSGGQWPVADVNADGLWFQVPWETRSAERNVVVRAAGNPFEDLTPIGFDGDYWPSFPVRQSRNSPTGSELIAAHQDFRGVVSAADPARPGETIHVYMTGLGELAQEVPTGERGPFPPVSVAKPLACVGQVPGSPDRTPLQLAAVIYASGMIGFYQVDVTLPPNMPGGFWGLRCGDGIREAVGFFATGN